MLSLRLKTIASLVKKDAKVLDVGTDHAYLPIFLQKNHLCQSVIASDISKGAFEKAKENVEKYNCDIKLYLTDGLNNIDEEYDTLVIAGMGTLSIIHILADQTLPDNIILSSNNNMYELRTFMNKIGYQIEKEIICKDQEKYYDIIAYQKGHEKLSDVELRFGKSNNSEYFNYLYEKELNIYKSLSFKNKMKKKTNLKKLEQLAKQKK